MIRPDARVLVIVVARIGDTLLVTPGLRALKAALPQGKLTVLAHPKRIEVLQNLPFIDELAGITKTSAQARGWLGAKRFDLALVYGHDSALVRFALRASDRVIAFVQREKSLNGRLATAVADPQTPQHAVQHRLALLAPLGVTTDDLRLAYCASDAEREEARRWLGGHVRPGGPLIGLQIASFPTKAHRDWPLARFQELMQRILSIHAQAQFLLLGDKIAAEAAAPLLAAHPHHASLAAGRLHLRQSAALMAELDLYIGVDTGPTHIAGALGVPMVALYHCAYPGRNLVPLQHPACRMIEHPLTGKSAATDISMADIPAASVCEAAVELLAGETAGPRR